MAMRVRLAAYWSRLPFMSRLLATASCALLVACATMLFASARQEAREARGDLRVELAQELQTLPAALAEVVVIGDFASLQQQLDRYAARPRVVAVSFLDVSGTSLQGGGQSHAASAPDWFFKALEFHDLAGSADVDIGARHYGTVTLALSAQGLANRAWQRLRDHLAILLLAVALDFIGIWLVLRNGLAPLKRMERDALAIAAGALDTRMTVEGSPELRSLIATFNSMAAATQCAQKRLHQANAELRRFAEVTAHHLQEPARRLVSYAERLGGQLAGRVDDPEARLSLEFIGQQARRMKHLLADIERYLVADQPRGPVEPADAGKTVAIVLGRLAPRIAAAGVRVTVGRLPPARIDAARLADLFHAALDNALRHGRGDAPRIAISGATHGAMARYSVSDNGPGIEAQYRERVFRVFERLSAGGDTDSTGIGLAIVRRIAQSCDGRAWIEEAQGGGCRILFELPAEGTP